MKKFVSVLLIVTLVLTLFSCGKSDKKNSITADEGRITVLSLKPCDGLFVEKGKSDRVKSAATIVVQNNADQMLEYGLFVFRVNDIERAEFAVSALPAGEKCLVMETTARPMKSEDKYSLLNEESVFTYCDAETKPDKVSVDIKGSEFFITNNSGKASNVTVVYKYFRDGMYYGGIAFRGKFENIGSGETVNKTSKRFDSDCRLVNVTVD